MGTLMTKLSCQKEKTVKDYFTIRFSGIIF